MSISRPDFEAVRSPPPSGSRQPGPSLERRLPLLMAGLLAIAVSALLLAIHGELERAAVETAHARLVNGASELGELVDQSAQNTARQHAAAARAPALLDFVARRSSSDLDSVRVRGILNQFVAQSPRRYMAVAATSGETLMSAGTLPNELAGRTTALVRDLSPRDSVVTGLPVVVGTQAYSSVVAPIVVDGVLRGGLIRWTPIGATPATEAAINRIVDPRAEVYLVHPAANLVIDPGGDVRQVPFRLDDSSTAFQVRRGDADLLGARTLVDGSDWSIVALVSRDDILLSSSDLFQRLVLAGLAIVLIGALVAWLASRRITKPLIRVTEAAEALASGQYHEPIALARGDEIGRLAATFDEMAHRISEAHERLTVARAEAESANAAKSRFLGTMSHEIRTPLNAIVGYTEFLLVGIGGQVSPQQRAYVERVQTSARHLLALVSDLLDLSSIEAGRLRIECHPAPLRDPVHDAVAVLESQAHHREVTISTQCDNALWYRGDPARLRQILINLLSNAVKFSDKGGEVAIVCGVTATPDPAVAHYEESRWTTVTVRDGGVGIAPDKVEAIWDPFVQGDDSRTRTHGGSGLGLTISRRLARLMQGEITVESEPGRGAAFTVWLPSSTPESAANSVTAA